MRVYFSYLGTNPVWWALSQDTLSRGVRFQEENASALQQHLDVADAVNWISSDNNLPRKSVEAAFGVQFSDEIDPQLHGGDLLVIVLNHEGGRVAGYRYLVARI